jgi:YqaJ-like viral recombinase domain
VPRPKLPTTTSPAIVERKLGPVEIIEVDEFEQGTPQWFDVRLGIPTASNFGTVMASGTDGEESKTRAQYMRVLAGEILTRKPAEGKIVTAAMQRGKDMEQEAREHYLATRFANLRQIAFMRRKLPSGRYFGSSPDGLIGKRKALEIKTMRPDLMIEQLERGAAGVTKHRPQVQGTMLVGDLDEVDLIIFFSGMPVAPTVTIYRDETYCREIRRAVEVFDFELNQLVDKIRRMS